MARINSYNLDLTITNQDLVLGSSYEGTFNGVPRYTTRNYRLEDLAEFFAGYDFNANLSLSTLEGLVSDVEDSVIIINSSITSLGNRITTTEGGISTNASSISSLNSTVSSLSSTVSGVSSTVQTLSNSVGSVQSSITSINSNLANKDNWDTAYGWGDHSQENYLTSEDLIISESDPVFTSHAAHNVTNEKISNWDIAYQGQITGFDIQQNADGSQKTITLTTRDNTTLSATAPDIYGITPGITDTNYYVTSGAISSAGLLKLTRQGLAGTVDVNLGAVFALKNHVHNNYASSVHSHPLNGLSDVTITSVAGQNILKYNGTEWVNSPFAHTHVTSDITDLEDYLSNFAHTHVVADITDLEDYLSTWQTDSFVLKSGDTMTGTLSVTPASGYGLNVNSGGIRVGSGGAAITGGVGISSLTGTALSVIGPTTLGGVTSVTGNFSVAGDTILSGQLYVGASGAGDSITLIAGGNNIDITGGFISIVPSSGSALTVGVSGVSSTTEHLFVWNQTTFYSNVSVTGNFTVDGALILGQGVSTDILSSPAGSFTTAYKVLENGSGNLLTGQPWFAGDIYRYNYDEFGTLIDVPEVVFDTTKVMFRKDLAIGDYNNQLGFGSESLDITLGQISKIYFAQGAGPEDPNNPYPYISASKVSVWDSNEPIIGMYFYESTTNNDEYLFRLRKENENNSRSTEPIIKHNPLTSYLTLSIDPTADGYTWQPTAGSPVGTLDISVNYNYILDSIKTYYTTNGIHANVMAFDNTTPYTVLQRGSGYGNASFTGTLNWWNGTVSTVAYNPQNGYMYKDLYMGLVNNTGGTGTNIYLLQDGQIFFSVGAQQKAVNLTNIGYWDLAYDYQISTISLSGDNLTFNRPGNFGTTSVSLGVYARTDVANESFNGTITASDFILGSDIRIKENIEDLKPEKINVDFKTFNYIGNDKKRFGVIAQELEENHPEFITENEEGVKGVSYIDLLVAKVAELEQRIKDLENGCS
jgi:hypothetical protein